MPQQKQQVSDTMVIMTMFYNIIVIICTILGVYYISGWMFALILALAKISVDDKE